MPGIETARRQVTQRCADCETRGREDNGGFRKEELAAILGELAPASNPQRMTRVGVRLSIANVLGFNHAGEREFEKGEVEAIGEAIRERQQEVRV